MPLNTARRFFSIVEAKILLIVLIGTSPSLNARAAEGDVLSWGASTPIPAGLTDVIAISSGGMVQDGHSLALKSDGTVVAFGSNGNGQINVPAGLNNVIQIAAGGRHSLALKSDGTVVGWGNPTGATVPQGLSNVKFIAAGMLHSLAIKQDGSVVGWGDNSYGQTIAPSGVTFLAVAGGEYHSLGLKMDGTVIGWGDASTGLSNIPQGLNNVVAVSDGYSYSLALRNDGTVVAWGGNIVGQLNIPPGLNNVVQISAGNNHHSLALRADGTVVAWGHNSMGQTEVPPNLPPVKAVSAGNNYSLVVLVKPNQAPVCDAGADQTVSAVGAFATVQLDGSQSFDPDGDLVEFEWSAAANSGAIIANPSSSKTSGIFPVGPTLVTLAVNDGRGGISVDDVLITVQDTTPPVVVCTTDKIILWPPDHKMQDVFVVIQASDAITSAQRLQVQCSITSNQADDSTGDGSNVGDVNGHDGYSSPVPVVLSYNASLNRFEGSVKLRAERSGNIDTRIYSVNAVVTDSSGNRTSSSCVVITPHDQKK